MGKLSMKPATITATADRNRSKQLYMQALAIKSDRSTWQKYAQSLYDMREFTEADQILTTIINGDLPPLPRRNGN
jgi:hypothetical protein